MFQTQSPMRGTLYTDLGSTVFKSSTSKTVWTVWPFLPFSRYISSYNIQLSLYSIYWTFFVFTYNRSRNSRWAFLSTKSNSSLKIRIIMNLMIINPLSPSIHIQILQTDLHTFSYRISWENLFKDQSIFSWVIILLILITFLFTVYG